MEAVFSLIEYQRARTVEHLVGDFLTAMGRQTVHHDRPAARVAEQFAVDLEGLEVAPPLGRLLLVAHRGPGVGIYDVGPAHRLDRIVRKDAQLIVAHPLNKLALRFISSRAAEPQLETRERGRLDPALREVKAVADVGDAQLAQIAETLAER